MNLLPPPPPPFVGLLLSGRALHVTRFSSRGLGAELTCDCLLGVAVCFALGAWILSPLICRDFVAAGLFGVPGFVVGFLVVVVERPPSPVAVPTVMSCRGRWLTSPDATLTGSAALTGVALFALGALFALLLLVVGRDTLLLRVTLLLGRPPLLLLLPDLLLPLAISSTPALWSSACAPNGPRAGFRSATPPRGSLCHPASASRACGT